MKQIFLTLFIILSLAISPRAQQTSFYSTDNGALDGYDPVAYFTQGKAVKGTTEFVYTWQNSEWHFSSDRNRDSFMTDPIKYAPQYGGYCAYGCAEGHKSPTRPDAWTIVNDKLYLNYNKQVRTEWMKNKDEQIKKADHHWEILKDKKE